MHDSTRSLASSVFSNCKTDQITVTYSSLPNKHHSGNFLFYRFCSCYNTSLPTKLGNKPFDKKNLETTFYSNIFFASSSLRCSPCSIHVLVLNFNFICIYLFFFNFYLRQWEMCKTVVIVVAGGGRHVIIIIIAFSLFPLICVHS